jgi:hypothetical protein
VSHGGAPSARTWVRIHTTLTLIWVALVLPTLLWWRDSVEWVAVMSLWANIAAHWAAAQGARAEESNSDD